jgi:hypothetical protein
MIARLCSACNFKAMKWRRYGNRGHKIRKIGGTFSLKDNARKADSHHQ